MNGLARSAQSKVDTVSASRIRNPPMVGVPFFLKCVSGPSSRIGWPRCWRLRSISITRVPNRKEISSAVSSAPPDLNVM